MQLHAIGTLLLAAVLLAQPSLAEPRIISTDAAATGIVFALGVDEALVGVDVTSQLPDPYRDLPRVGYHRALSPEGLLALNPDLLLGSEQLGPPAVIPTLRSAGVAVLQLPAPRDTRTLAQNVRRIATQLQRDDAADQLLAQLETDVDGLAQHALQGMDAVFLLSIEPGKLRLAGTDTAGGAFIELLGASNLGRHQGYRNLSAEALLALSPDLILVADHEGGSAAALLERNPILRHSSAAQSNAIRQINATNLVAGISLGAVAEARALARDLTSAVAQR